MSEERQIDSFRASTWRWLIGSFGGWLTLLLSLLGIGLVILAVRWVSNISTRYTLTDQRLIVRRGIIMKREDEIELFRVKDIRVDYSIANQLMGIGTITLRSSDATTRSSDFAIRDVPDARPRREKMRSLIDQARQRRRVREVDYDVERY